MVSNRQSIDKESAIVRARSFPNLGGQEETYLASALKAYREKTRAARS